MELRSSAEESGVTIDFAGFVDSTVDIGVPGCQELVSLGRSACLARPDPETVRAVSTVLGAPAAMTAVEIAGAFSMINRVMEATGQPVLVGHRQRMLPVLEQLGAVDFPHSGLTTERERSTWQKVRTKIGRSIRRS
jgi:hypothetical protein